MSDHGKKPKNQEHALTIYFDSAEAIEEFTAWYLDGGGEQQSEFYAKSWGDNWMHVEDGSEDDEENFS